MMKSSVGPDGIYYAAKVRLILSHFYPPFTFELPTSHMGLDPFSFQSDWTQKAQICFKAWSRLESQNSWPRKEEEWKTKSTKFTTALCTAIGDSSRLLAGSKTVVDLLEDAGAWYKCEIDSLYETYTTSVGQYTEAWFLKIIACIKMAQEHQEKEDQIDRLNIGIYPTPCPTP